MRLQHLFTNSFLWRAPTLMFSLAPTNITFSSYNQVEAPTSTCTTSNLFKEYNMVFLAPPYHSCFSDLNMFSTICRKTDITMHTNSVLIYFQICLCTLVPLIVSVLSILEKTQSPLSFCNPHFVDDPCTNFSTYRERAHPFITHILLYIYVLKPFTCSYAWWSISMTNQTIQCLMTNNKSNP